MPYQHFLVPAQGGMVERQFQDFLRAHAILKVERRFVEREEGVFWAYSVEFDEAPERGYTASPAGPAKDRDRIDYKEILSEPEFVTYVKLRDWRTEEAKTRKVPPFSIFTNEELAQIAQRRPASGEALQEIPGIGVSDEHGQRCGAQACFASPCVATVSIIAFTPEGVSRRVNGTIQ